MNPRKNKILQKKPAPVLIVVLTLIILGTVAGILAKYIGSQTRTEDTASPDFYFTSTFLTRAGSSYTLTPDTDSLEIPVCNYADHLRITGEDIDYTYTVTKGDTEVKKGSGTLTATGDATTENISLTGMTAGTYDVIVKATHPFAATLKGTFVIPKESQDIHYSVNDQEGSPYVILTVWTDNYDGKVQVNWPAGVIPDSTDTKLEGVNTYSSGSYVAGKATGACGAHSSNVYRFFKEDPSKTFTQSQFTATKAS